MNPRSFVSWPVLTAAENCGLRFLWTFGFDKHDLGAGPGNPKPRPRVSQHHAVVSDVFATLIQSFYNDELWKNPRVLRDRLEEIADRSLIRILRSTYVDPNRASQEDLQKVCKDGALGFVRTIKENRLLGPYAKADEDLVGWIDRKNPIGGRVSAVIRRDDNGVSLLQGKSTKKKEEVDLDEARWNALLFRLAYRKPPERTGFVWFRFPFEPGGSEDPETGNLKGETGVTWVDFSESDLSDLAARALAVRKFLWKGKFEANPRPSYCKTCPYETVCPERGQQRERNAAKRPKKLGPTIAEISEATGFVDLDL